MRATDLITEDKRNKYRIAKGKIPKGNELKIRILSIEHELRLQWN